MVLADVLYQQAHNPKGGSDMAYDVRVAFNSIAWNIDPTRLNLHEVQVVVTQVLQMNDALRKKAEGGRLENGLSDDLVLQIMDEIGELREAMKKKDPVNIAEELTDIFARIVRLLSTKDLSLVAMSDCIAPVGDRYHEAGEWRLPRFQEVLNQDAQSASDPLSPKRTVHAYRRLCDVAHDLEQNNLSNVRFGMVSVFSWYTHVLYKFHLSLATVVRLFLVKQHLIAEGDLEGKKRDKVAERALMEGVLVGTSA